MDRNTQEVTREPVLCPVRSGSAVVKILLQIPGTTLDTPNFTFFNIYSCAESLR